MKVKNDPDDPHLEFKGAFDSYIKTKIWVKFLMIHKPEVGQKFLSLVIYLMVLNLNGRTCKVECDKTNELYVILNHLKRNDLKRVLF